MASPPDDEAAAARLAERLKKPEIHLDAPAHEVATNLIAALTAANTPAPMVYQRGRTLVRVVDSHSGGRPVRVIETLTADSLRFVAGQVAYLVKAKGKSGDFETDATREQLAAVLTAPVWSFPVLAGIVEVPVVRPDGSLHATPGYDAATELLYQPAADLVIPPIPAVPTPADVAAAKALILDELLGEFPFKTPAERANAVALLLLPYARLLIDGPTPIHLVEAPTAGTGKSLLVEACLYPAIGDALGGDSDKPEEPEMTKWITTMAMDGAAVCWLDNVGAGLDSAALANATTSIRWSNRVLGSNDRVNIVFRPIWVVTANNPTLSNEMIRRTVRIRIDAETDRPAQRPILRHPQLRTWVKAHRGALIAAALTLIRAWVCAGRPLADLRVGSYEAYAPLMGGILASVGIPHFLANLSELYEVSDPETNQWSELVALWAERFGYTPVRAGDVFGLALSLDTFDLGGGHAPNERSQKTRFGMALARQRDRIYGGLKIVQAGIVHKAAQWRLMPVRTAADFPNSGEPGNLWEPFSAPAYGDINNNFLYADSIKGSQRFPGSPPVGTNGANTNGTNGPGPLPVVLPDEPGAMPVPRGVLICATCHQPTPCACDRGA